jgi:hypothetical protein
MKKIITLLLLFISIISFSQTQSVAEKIKDLTDLYSKRKFQKVEILSKEILNNQYGNPSNKEKSTTLSLLSSILVWDDYENKNYSLGYNYILELLEIWKNGMGDFPEKDKNIKAITNLINDLEIKHPELRATKVVLSKVTENNPQTTQIGTETKLAETTKPASDDKTVTLTVSGTGKTPEEARLNALRSAIEQAFGAFISSKTEILNDKLVKDEIVSVASGNVQKFNILNEFILPSGGFNTTLLAIVSINKLTSFIESKGGIIEFKGGLFSVNIKQQILNEKAEEKAIFDMVSILHETLQTSFDYKIKAEEPVSVEGNNQKWMIRTWIYPFANKNMEFCSDYCLKTLTSIGMSQAEVENYQKLKKDYSSLLIIINGVQKRIFLRSRTSYSLLESLANNMQYYLKLYNVKNGLEELNNKGLFHRDGNDREFCWYNGGKDEISTFTGIQFYNLGQKAAIIYDENIYNLENLEKITAYSIVPLGIKSNFKNGGYVVYEKDGHGLVMAPFDIKINRYEYNSEGEPLLTAKKQCQDFGLYGYKDWYLPSKTELTNATSILWEKLLGVSHELNFGVTSYLYQIENNFSKYAFCNMSSSMEEDITIKFDAETDFDSKKVIRAFRKF